MDPGAPAPLVLADPSRLGLLIAELVANRLAARPRARLLVAAEPQLDGMFGVLRDMAAGGALDAGAATVLQLHEHAGAAGGATGADALRAALRGIPLGALVTIDGGAADLAAVARRHEAAVESAPVDLAILALGADGHVALDEPPAGHASGVRVVPLPGGGTGVTVGLGTLWRARELIVVALGAERATALEQMLDAPAGPASPASLLRDHPRATVVCDPAAAALLAPPPAGAGSDRVLVVLGHREPGISAEHRISSESRARLRHARRLAERTPARAVVLTGYTSTGGLSEAEQMKGSWDESLAPALLEVAGRNTAENASRSLPIVLALGVRHVVVVSSAWHVRVPWFFGPYRRFGLKVSYRASFAHGSWPRMLAEEARSAPRMVAQREAAFAAARRTTAAAAAYRR